MRTAIFIKTYSGDFAFLRYCIKSIQKFCTGFDEIIIQCPPRDHETLLRMCPDNFKVIPIKEKGDGYMFQQVAKLSAWLHTDCEQILYVDSDCVFFAPCTPETFMRDGKPLLMKTHYSKVGDAIFWQEATARAIGYKSEFEWMRRLPAMYLRKTLQEIASVHPNLHEYILSIKDRQFSEFNFIGQFIEKHSQSDYSIHDTDDGWIVPVCQQFWSWGSLTDEVENKIKSFLE